jgi:hypothetical protein
LKLDQIKVESLARLRSNEDFKRFAEVVREYEHDLNERLVKATDAVTIHRAQGGVEACRELIQAVHDAPETLRKFK